jgi:hypothetical protein
LIVQDEQHTAQHPNVHSPIDWVTQVNIHHLWRSVHQSCVLFESFLIFVNFALWNDR